MAADVTGSSAAWAAFLDALESELQAVQRTPEGQVRQRAFVPPDGLGPLPAELAERARVLIGTLSTTSDVVRDQMARTSEQLRELRRHDPRGPKPASSFDTRA